MSPAEVMWIVLPWSAVVLALLLFARMEDLLPDLGPLTGRSFIYHC
jgi:hypothetical protein